MCRLVDDWITRYFIPVEVAPPSPIYNFYWLLICVNVARATVEVPYGKRHAKAFEEALDFLGRSFSFATFGI